MFKTFFCISIPSSSRVWRKVKEDIELFIYTFRSRQAVAVYIEEFKIRSFFISISSLSKYRPLPWEKWVISIWLFVLSRLIILFYVQNILRFMYFSIYMRGLNEWFISLMSHSKCQRNRSLKVRFVYQGHIWKRILKSDLKNFIFLLSYP